MARRTNYGFEKRQKELDRQKKKDAKAEKKQARKDGEAAGGLDEAPLDDVDQETGADEEAPGKAF